MLRGHYTYFGVTSNGAALSRLREEVRNAWRKWLSRRSQRAALSWNSMLALLKRYALPQPRIVHRYAT
jgi:RNA-directed DNA polymerase